jgi:hypothetical protein
MQAKLRVLAVSVVGIVCLFSSSCDREAPYAKWRRHFDEVARNPRLPVATEGCVDELGDELARQLLTEVSTEYARFAFDGERRFAQIKMEGFQWPGDPSDGLRLQRVGASESAMWYGYEGTTIGEIRFDDENVIVTVFGTLNYRTGERIPESQPIEVAIPWPKGTMPEPGILLEDTPYATPPARDRP